MKYKNNQIKAHFDKDKIGYIIREYLGCESMYILNNLNDIYYVLDSVYKIIDKYGEDTRNIEYIFMSDYEEGRASDNYNNIIFLEDFNGIYVYELKESEEEYGTEETSSD